MKSVDDHGVEIRGDHLKGLKVDLIVTGGIAAIESPKLARELRRYEAEVRGIMTDSAQRFVTPLSLEWGCRQSVVTNLTGQAEHISDADVCVIYPCTMNFLVKVSLGIADSPATTLVQSLLGRKPVFFVPAMHESLEANPLYQERLKSLKKLLNIFVLEPIREEAKAKVPAVEDVVASICHFAGRESSLRGLGVVLSLGPTRSKIDDMRFVSNRSTGALGLAIANELYRRGMNLQLVAGPTEVALPSYIPSTRVQTNDEMAKAFQKAAIETKARVGIFSAAVLDFTVQKPASGKLSSKNGFEISLTPAPKLIQKFKSAKFVKVGFKLEAGLSEKQLVEVAREAMKSQGAQILVANRLEDVSREKHTAFILSAEKTEPVKASGKSEIAKALAEILENQNLKLNSKAYPGLEALRV